MLSVNTIGENAQVPGIYAETFVPDQLVAGNLKLVTDDIVVTGGPYARGTVLGQVTSNPAIVTEGSTNTGNGAVGAVTVGTGALIGNYVLTAKTATDFGVVDPEGNALPDMTVGTAYNQEGLSFTVTAGGTAYVAGDTINIEVVDAIGTFKESVKTASDGSQNPSAILVNSMGAAGPSANSGYMLGEFNARALIFDASWTIQTLTTALRAVGIFVKSSVSAADPT